MKLNGIHHEAMTLPPLNKRARGVGVSLIVWST